MTGIGPLMRPRYPESLHWILLQLWLRQHWSMMNCTKSGLQAISLNRFSIIESFHSSFLFGGSVSSRDRLHKETGRYLEDTSRHRALIFKLLPLSKLAVNIEKSLVASLFDLFHYAFRSGLFLNLLPYESPEEILCCLVIFSGCHVNKLINEF